MFNFLNLGFEGYKKIAYKDLRNARMLSKALEATYFKVFSNIHRRAGGGGSSGTSTPVNNHMDNPEQYMVGLPVVAFRLSDKYKAENPRVKQVWIQTLLRTKGWIVPNYHVSSCVCHDFLYKLLMFCVRLRRVQKM